MNGYDLSRNWFNFCFDNPEKVKPIHSAIFFFAVEHCNRLGGKDKFGFPSQMTMEAIGVKKHQTYSKALNELSEWGFITFIERSKNQWSANIISLSAVPKKGIARGKALDKATIKHGAKQGRSTGQSMDSIDKPLTINQEPINQEGVNPPHFLVDWLNDNAPRVQKLKEPITTEQAERIESEFDIEFAKQVFTSMHNYKRLTSNVISANLTFRQWAAKDLNNQPNGQKPKTRAAEALENIANGGNEFLNEIEGLGSFGVRQRP
jgi:hypothetical protein